jgi:hypothetical protein
MKNKYKTLLQHITNHKQWGKLSCGYVMNCPNFKNQHITSWNKNGAIHYLFDMNNGEEGIEIIYHDETLNLVNHTYNE